METKYITKCNNGHVVKGTFADLKFDRSNPKRGYLTCSCGSKNYGKVMDIETTSTKCGGRCTTATNSKCHCECGGENHGISKINF